MFVQHLSQTDILVIVGIVISTTLYAVLLEALDYKDHLEPDFTWVEVLLGNAIILLWIEAWRRMGGLAAAGDQGHSEATWVAFIAGGAPVIVWQIGGLIRRRRAAWRYRRDASRGGQ